MKLKDATQTYEIIADWFDEARSRELFEQPIIYKALEGLSGNASILDIGCGMAEPIGSYLINKGCRYTGTDNCDKLIKLATTRYPNAAFLNQDMRALATEDKFDVLIAWNSFFHLTQHEQIAMFPLFAHHANDGAKLLFTTGTQAGEVWSDNGGEQLYHAALSPDEYKKLLLDNGFELIEYKLDDPNCHGTSWWLAGKSA